MKEDAFSSTPISDTATIYVHGNIETVFPLFGAFEEKKWAQGWDPQPVYPQAEIIEEGMIFTTPSGNTFETSFTWTVTHYQPSVHFIKYLVPTENRFFTVSVKCLPLTNALTSAEIMCTYTALNSKGNLLNTKALPAMYETRLKDWEHALNHYLEMGKMFQS